MESEFYVMLPSNSSMQYFPDNKTSNFVTKLSRTLQLDGEWEGDLAEIDYPHTWYNIRKGNNSLEHHTRRKEFFGNLCSRSVNSRNQCSTWILRESTGFDRRIAQSWTV